MIDLFIRTIEKYGDSPALTDNDGERTISYKELSDLSDRVALKLMSMGVRRGDCIVIRMDRCIEYIASELAVLKAGGVIVPLIPGYPKERVDYIVNDCHATIIIDEKFFEDVDKFDISQSSRNPDFLKSMRFPETNKNDRAFIIYTSGSTGNPKGVVYTLESVVAQITRSYKCVQDIKPLIYAASATMSFCVTINEYLRLLTLGAHIHILSERVRSDVKLIEDYYEKNHITCGFLSPRIAKLYKNKDKDLKRLFTASEKVVNLYAEGYEIYNTYGQTETIGTITEFIIDRAYDNTPIGKPLEGISLHVFDEDGNEVPEGQEGEIIIEGILPCEYNNLPEQTAHTFKKLPNGNVQVRTGDIGKVLPDGNMLYLNRNDWMIKIHGQRVEPGEIEAVMNKADGVTGSIVKAFESEDGSMLLCGFYTTGVSKNTDNTSQEQSDVSDQDDIKSRIIEKLESKLPHYMLPNVLIRMDEFPVNANGKIDRKSIQRPNVSELLTQYEKPVGKVEEALCSAMEKILNCEKIGRNDNFYELGGNSINAVALMLECGLEGMAAEFIMMGKTVQGIAQLYVEQAKNTKPPLKKSDMVKSIYPMTSAQINQYYECTKIGYTTDLNDFIMYSKLPDNTDIERFKDAVVKTFCTHDDLFIGFDVSDAGYFMLRNPAKNMTVPEVTVAKDEFEAYKRKKATIKRDIKNDRLFSTEIIHVGDATLFFLNISHLIFDGVTLPKLYEDIGKRYAESAGCTSDDAPKTGMDIFALSLYEESVKQTDFYRKAMDYIDKKYSMLENRTVYDNPVKQDSFARRNIAKDMPRESIESTLKKYGVSETTYVQAAFSLMLMKLFRKKDFAYMVEYNGRQDSLLKSTYGVLAKAVYMVAELNGNPSVKEYLNTVQNEYQQLLYYDVENVVALTNKYPAMRTDIWINFRTDLGLALNIEGQKCSNMLGMIFDDKHMETLLTVFLDLDTDGNYLVTASSGYMGNDMVNKAIDLFEEIIIKLSECEIIGEIMQ